MTAKVKAEPAGGEVTWIKLKDIVTEGQSVRAVMDDDHVVELSMSIAKHGLLEPIVVRPLDNGTFQLLAGFHRLAAFHRLNRSTILAVIYSDRQTPTKAIALVENVCRRDMSLKEEIEAVNYLHHTEGLSPSQICEVTSKSRAWVDRRLMAKSLPDVIKEALFEGAISLGHAEALAEINNEGMLRYAINNVIATKLTVQQTRDIVSVYLSTPTISDAVEAGLQKAEELQRAPETRQTCSICHTLKSIVELMFIKVCFDCGNWAQTAAEPERQKEEEPNGSQPNPVQN